MSTTLPYDDKDMYYELDLRMYVLTKDACDDYLGVDLSENFNGGDIQMQRFIEELSEDIYEFVYDHTFVNSVKTKRYLMAKDENLRPIIKKALLYQLRYAFISSANLLKDMHGVHIEKAKALDLSQLRGKVNIAHQAIKVLSRSGLLYSGGSYYKLSFEEDGTY